MYDTLCLMPTYRGYMDTILAFIRNHPTLAIMAVVFLSVGAVSEWNRIVRPYFADRNKVRQLADILVARYGDRAEEMAFIEEDRAWRYSETFKQGIWRRVRLELRKRQALTDQRSTENRTEH